MMRLRILLFAALLPAFVSGCMVDYLSPISDSGPPVVASPFVGGWKVVRTLGSPKVAEGVVVTAESSGPNKLTIEAKFKTGRVLRFEGSLSQLGDAVFLSHRSISEPRTEPAWRIVRLLLEDEGRRIAIRDIDPVDLRPLVDSGQVQGDSYDVGIIGDLSVNIDEDPIQTRQFVQQHVGMFTRELATLER